VVATTRQLFNGLRTFRNQLALKLGADVTRCPQDVRVMSNATLAAVSVLAKALTDAGVITVAQLQAAADNALGPDGSVWDPEVPTDQIPAGP
jgi:hypothetical protein